MQYNRSVVRMSRLIVLAYQIESCCGEPGGVSISCNFGFPSASETNVHNELRLFGGSNCKIRLRLKALCD